MDELTQPLRGVSLLGLPVSVTEELVQHAMAKETSSGGAWRATHVLREFIHSGSAAHADRSGADVSQGNSSRLSAYLAVGALSPRQVYHEAHGVEGAQWIMSHMEMRDFFLYYSFSMGRDAFSRDGVGKKRLSNGNRFTKIPKRLHNGPRVIRICP